MRKPPNILYGVDESPPLGVSVLSGLQHVGAMASFLVYPMLVAQAAGASLEAAAAMVSMTLIALAVGAVLQATPLGPSGSGYLCQPTPTVVYLVPSLVAVKHGGLPLVFGMTIAAGMLEVALARVLDRLRALFPAEIAGLVVLLAGIATGVVGLRTVVGTAGAGSAPATPEVALALGTLGLMLVLNVWGRGALHLFCVLIGMASGWVAAWALGMLDLEALRRLEAGALFALPVVGHIAWELDLTLALPFAVAAIAASFKVMGNVTTCQKANDADLVRADMRSIARGVTADGLGTMVAGALGATGTNSSTGAVGLASATGVTSRKVSYAVAAILLAFAFMPKLVLLFALMPRPVVGAALVFASTFIVINGLELISSRLLDARRTLVIGLAIVFGLAVESFPGLVAALPAAAQLALGTSLVLGTLVGLGLNLLFRIGLKKTVSMTVQPEALDRAAIGQFMDVQGAAWGARRDVLERAKFNLEQSIETIAGSGVARGPLVVEATFDEFDLDLRVSYEGVPLELPEKLPTTEEIIESEDGERKLAGYMLRRLADRVAATHRGGRSTILFHFDH